MIWKILGIEKTKDEEVIRNAYHEKLHYVNPEDDEEGFKELRSAFEHAMEYAGEPEDEAESNNEEVIQGKKTDVDYWIDKIEKIGKAKACFLYLHCLPSFNFYIRVSVNACCTRKGRTQFPLPIQFQTTIMYELCPLNNTQKARLT